MNSYLTVWFRSLLRPSVTSAEVQLYENGKQIELGKYSDLMLHKLTYEIDGLFPVDNKSPYWFETEVYEKGSCFKKSKVHMTITCYTKDFLSNGYKKKFDIPIRYRKKMFESYHTIRPEPVGSKMWSKGIQVKFSLAR